MGGEGAPPTEDIRPHTKLLWPFLFPQSLLLSVDCETQRRDTDRLDAFILPCFRLSLDTLQNPYASGALMNRRQPYLLWVNDIICRVGGGEKRKDAFSK